LIHHCGHRMNFAIILEVSFPCGRALQRKNTLQPSRAARVHVSQNPLAPATLILRSSSNASRVELPARTLSMMIPTPSHLMPPGRTSKYELRTGA
ncbi:uncharacterized protein B0H18DRAFT_989667, partial [Fomitopsis serialis]|uniref:uncharacterized protein n=1 Tax=Fomitopsis serialis TaxID=139415 RepID=UPI002007D8EE